MPKRDPDEVAGDYITAVRRAVSCVTRSILLNTTDHDSAVWPHLLYIPHGPAPLKMHDVAETRLALDFSHGYQIVRRPDQDGWQVVTTGYYYSFSLRDGPELLAYHWHPEPDAHVRWPHVHLEAGCQLGYSRLHRAHLPTGLIAPQEVLSLAVEAVGVEPLRDNWRSIFDHRP
jgi:hypothetical protein